MKVYRGFTDPTLSARPRAVAIGIFDGVHRGHQLILRRTVARARALKRAAVVVTFDPHPVKILDPGRPHPILISLEHRLRLLSEAGIREAVVVPFTRAFSRTPRERFVEALLKKRLGAAALCVGHDFRFGRGGEGDAAYLCRVSRSLGFQVEIVPALRQAGSVVSSTRIRRLIEAGKLSQASRLLGRPVSVFGTVIRGRGRGRSVGFPTANLDPHHEALPPAGVYAAWGRIGRRSLRGVIHIGQRPTFGDREKSLEVHFLNFDGRLYGRSVELAFVRRLRPIRRFSSTKELAKAIKTDIVTARIILSTGKQGKRRIAHGLD